MRPFLIASALFASLLCPALSGAHAASHLTDFSLSRASGTPDARSQATRRAFARLRPAGDGRNPQAAAHDTVSVVQLGDSHTAADYFTGRLRQRLQAHYGQGPTGWLSPMRAHGQRSDLVTWDANGWQLANSLKDGADDYPLGGYIATPLQAGSITLTPRQPVSGSASFRVLLRRPRQAAQAPDPVAVDGQGQRHSLSVPADGRWHERRLVAPWPLRFEAMQAGQYDLGGLWVRDSAQGLSLSAIGINGAQHSLLQRWRRQWLGEDLARTEPDLLLLAFGTNEVFNSRLDTAQMRHNLNTLLEQLKARFRRTSIVVLGVPDLASNTAAAQALAECNGKRPQNTTLVQAILRSAAEQQRVLYWDWQAAMGGRCSMAQWQQQGLAHPDGIHFSQRGYEKLGDLLADDLLQWLAPAAASPAR